MKALTSLLVAFTILLTAGAKAQYWPNASISGTVLSVGPLGFVLEGPDGNYGIELTVTTVVSDPWQGVTTTGFGDIEPGMFVTASGYPTGQWTMRAVRVLIGQPWWSYSTWFYPSYSITQPGAYYNLPLATLTTRGNLRATHHTPARTTSRTHAKTTARKKAPTTHKAVAKTHKAAAKSTPSRHRMAARKVY